MYYKKKLHIYFINNIVSYTFCGRRFADERRVGDRRRAHGVPRNAAVYEDRTAAAAITGFPRFSRGLYTLATIRARHTRSATRSRRTAPRPTPSLSTVAAVTVFSFVDDKIIKLLFSRFSRSGGALFYSVRPSSLRRRAAADRLFLGQHSVRQARRKFSNIGNRRRSG